MFYILYQVTNTVNGKIYVGVHKTKKLEDGYMGSGKVINAAIKKYGIENFTRVVLEQFDNSAAMFAREKEVVTEEFLDRDDTYNLRRGGDGGFDYINKFPELQNNRTVEGSRRGAKLGGEKAVELKLGMHNPEIRKTIFAYMQTNNLGIYDSATQQLGVEAARMSNSVQKRKETFAAIGHSQGEKNSQFGSKWITNEVSNKKIKKDDPIPEGWRAGRKVSPL